MTVKDTRTACQLDTMRRIEETKNKPLVLQLMLINELYAELNKSMSLLHSHLMLEGADLSKIEKHLDEAYEDCTNLKEVLGYAGYEDVADL